MSSAPLQPVFPTNSHYEQTYNPRSKRFDFASSPHREQVFEVFHLFSSQHPHTALLAVLFEVLVEAVERARLAFLVSCLVPVRLSHIFELTHRECSHACSHLR